jgi:peptide/nickel transport system substrate-binding protein
MESIIPTILSIEGGGKEEVMPKYEKVLGNKISRRDFVKGTAALGFAAATFGLPGKKVFSADAVTETLLVGTQEQPTWVAPEVVTWYMDYMITRLMFNTLIEFDRYGKTIKFEPRIAEALPMIKQSGGGVVYEFKIRKGIKTHCGESVTANTVKYSYERTLRIGKGVSYIFEDSIKRGKIEVPDDYTVRFILPEPVGPGVMYAMFAAEVGGIVCQKCSEKYGNEQFNEHPCGTGPWKFDHWVRDKEFVVTRNDEYFEGAGRLKRIFFRFFSDPTTLVLALKSGEIDVAGRHIPTSDRADLKKNPNLSYTPSTLQWVRFMPVVHCQKPFDNLKVRQALLWAIDWNKIIQVSMKGEAVRLYSMLPPVFPEHIDAMKEMGYEFKPEKAKALLAEAGFPKGFDTELWFTPAAHGPEEDITAVMIGKYLTDVGIRAKINHAEKAQFVDWYRGGPERKCSPMPLYLLGWIPDFVSPYNYLQPFIYPGGYLGKPTGYNTDPKKPESPDALRLCNTIRSAFDDATFKKAVQDAQRLMIKDVTEIPMWFPNDAYFCRKNVRGWYWAPVVQNIDFRKVWKQ